MEVSKIRVWGLCRWGVAYLSQILLTGSYRSLFATVAQTDQTELSAMADSTFDSDNFASILEFRLTSTRRPRQCEDSQNVVEN